MIQEEFFKNNMRELNASMPSLVDKFVAFKNTGDGCCSI
jgi:hypothetical protein